MMDDKKETYPFCDNKTGQHGVDAYLWSHGSGETSHHVELRGFGNAVCHAGSADTDSLISLLALHDQDACSKEHELRKSGLERHTPILPVVIICPPSAFFSNVARAADRSALGTLTFAEKHLSHSSSDRASRSSHSAKRVQPCLIGS